jgi:hypothetical protein
MYQEMYKDRVSALRWAFLARRIVCISEIQGGTGFGFCLTAEAFRLRSACTQVALGGVWAIAYKSDAGWS